MTDSQDQGGDLLSPVELQIQTREQSVGGFDQFQPHPTSTCPFHGIPEHRIPGRRWGLYRCPVCAPDRFLESAVVAVMGRIVTKNVTNR